MRRWRLHINYLAGLVYGDGSLYYYERNQEYFILIYDNDYEFLRRVGEETKKIFNISYTIVKPSKTKNYYKLQFTNAELYRLLEKLIKERPKRLTKSFIRGILDAEGTIYMDKKERIALEIAMNNKQVIERMQKWLIRIGVRATVTRHQGKRGNRKTIYKVRIRGWDNVGKAIELLKPQHPKIADKYKKLKLIKSQVVYDYVGPR